MERQLILDIRELRQLGVECAKCKTATVFSIDSERIPLSCPSCEKLFYEKMEDRKNPICLLVAALKAVSEKGDSKNPSPTLTAHVPISPVSL
jgi:hypothetical protein